MSRLGSLFSGYGGLDLAVEAVTGARTAWVSDVCKVEKGGKVGHYTPHRGPCRILAHRFPDAPNLGDISRIDWAAVEPVEILTGGFPCQDVSHAGKRAGLRPDTRTGLWSQMAYAIDQLRPRLVVAENVRGLLSAAAHSDVEPCPWCLGDDSDESALRALGAVLGDLADLGYDAEWVGLPAAGVGAPHGRFRVFVVAHPAGDPWRLRDRDYEPAADTRRRLRRKPWRPTGPSEASSRGTRGELAGCGNADSDATELRRGPEGWNDGLRTEGLVEVSSAPAPVEFTGRATPRLSPRFVEWLMGLPAGWVTDVPGLTRNEQLKALGNGVVPQQAAAALEHLLAALPERVSA